MAAVFSLTEVIMDKIIAYFNSMNLDFYLFSKASLILLAGTLALSLMGRFVFGKRSMLNHAVSSAIAILFVYAITVVIRSCGAQLDRFVAPLPFINILGTDLILIDFQGLHYTILCTEILSMVILAFLVNLAEGWLSKGKSFLGWLFFRVLTVVIGYAFHLIVTWLFNRYLPQGLVTYAPTVLLGLLVLLMATGVLKILIGALLSTVNPIIGGLYTFFFANMIGKKITKAVLTTAILGAIVFGLRYAGIAVITIAPEALTAYIPLLVLLIPLWYLTNKIL